MSPEWSKSSGVLLIFAGSSTFIQFFGAGYERASREITETSDFVASRVSDVFSHTYFGRSINKFGLRIVFDPFKSFKLF